jgi:hypothetical protein
MLTEETNKKLNTAPANPEAEIANEESHSSCQATNSPVFPVAPIPIAVPAWSITPCAPRKQYCVLPALSWNHPCRARAASALVSTSEW